VSADGKAIAAHQVHLLARFISMGQLHHAMTGTGAVALSVAAAIAGTIVHRQLRADHDAMQTTFAHPSGVLTVGAQAEHADGQWKVLRSVMSRSARRLMEGWVRVPAPR